MTKVYSPRMFYGLPT